MTRDQALDELEVLSRGLRPGVDGADRLLERVAAHREPEALRAALVDLGARGLLVELAAAVGLPR